MTIPAPLAFLIVMIPVLIVWFFGCRVLFRWLEPRFWAWEIRRGLRAINDGTVPGAFETEGGKAYLAALERNGMSDVVKAAVERVKAADARAAAEVPGE